MRYAQWSLTKKKKRKRKKERCARCVLQKAERRGSLACSLPEERVDIHRVPSARTQHVLLIMRMQISRKKLVVNEIHHRILRLAGGVAAAPDARRTRALASLFVRRGVLIVQSSRCFWIVVPRRVSSVQHALRGRNEGRVPERLRIGLMLRHHRRVPEGVT